MRAVIFDFDGVLVNSEPLHEEGLRRAAALVGLELTHSEYVGAFLGLDDRDCYRLLAQRAGRAPVDALLREFDAVKSAYLTTQFAGGEPPCFPGVPELVQACAARGPVAICSGAKRVEIETILAHKGLRRHFRAVISADDVPRSKPDPSCYALAVATLGLSPAECTAIEDTPRGIQAALAAGLRVAGVAHSVPAADLHQAHRVFQRLDEIRPESLESL